MTPMLADIFNAVNRWLHGIWFKTPNSDLATNGQGELIFTGVDWVFMFILWISIISFLMLMIPMCWWAWKYRRRPGHVQQRTPNHNTVLEVTWVVVPLIILTFLFFWGFHGYMKSQIVGANAKELYITGQMWSWTVAYPEGFANGEAKPFSKDRTERIDGKEVTLQANNQEAPIIAVRKGQPVRFKMISQDVIHSFYIPDMRIKMDVFPNRYTTLSFTPINESPKDGKDGDKQLYVDYPIYCAEFCGNKHSEMVAFLRVLDEPEFADTMEKWSRIEDNYLNPDGTTPKGQTKVEPLWKLGEAVWKLHGCNSCHTIDGAKGTGPSWKGFYNKPVPISRGPAFDGKWDDYIRRSILEPAAQIHEGYESGNMPSYQGVLDKNAEKKIFGVIEFFKHLNGVETPAGTPAPKPAPGADSKTDKTEKKPDGK